ncbi:coiled-coil domain-containing protein 38 isoform X2 [Meriones unguiculatus]|uniref:coiled-coil domain-containing protein 38 isoform X2 n=1 Tax=Meriones unguiculatus TaxID=10047 RepID=UPI00293EB669|nr:coiled-coil domain-containing protein 38 isoform X2 [Meriones unguiculatus]
MQKQLDAKDIEKFEKTERGSKDHWKGRSMDVESKTERPYKIFFKDLFLFKENEVAAKKNERLMNRSMKIYQKTTFSSRMKSRSHLSQLAFYAEAGGGSYENLGLDPTLILRLTEGADRRRTAHQFINDQRDRFLLEYAVTTKKNTIQRFERLIAMKERQLRKAERKLQDDAMSFEEFLRENDQRSVDALKMAAQETLNKLQMTTELKKASMEVQAIKSEITKTEFLLKEYMRYGFFLMKLSPKHWQLQQSQKRAQESKSTPVLPRILGSVSSSKSETSAELNKKATSGKLRGSKEEQGQKKSAFGMDVIQSTIFNPAEGKSSEDSLERMVEEELLELDLMPELYFKEPEELLKVLTELEEQNLTLVQYSQDVDENLEDVNKREKVIQDKINNNIEFLMEHKQMLMVNCEREEEKAAELELRSRLFSFGEFNSDAQEKLIESLSKKINQVYRVCIGDAEVGSLTPIQKLVKVESRLAELSDLIDSIPKESVEAIERMKQKERRQKLREEKLKEKQRHQEERLRAALERAVSQPKKKVGRRLIYRSKPPSAGKQELLLVSDTRTKSQEEEYFFGA